MRKNKNLKGIVDFLLIGFVLVLLMTFILITKIIESDQLKIKVKVDLSFKADDSGSWELAFLKAQNKGKPYIETLAEASSLADKSSVQNDLDYIRADVESINSVDGTQHSVSVENTQIAGKPDSSSSIIPIPVPGGGKADVHIG